MDSLATDMKKIFSENQIMEYRDVYAGKSAAYKAAKRLFDIMASSAALIVLSPVFFCNSSSHFLRGRRSCIFCPAKSRQGYETFPDV